MEEWPEDVQQQVVELFKGYHHIFALTDLKLGCTSKIKHEIKLDNEVPFKDHYRCIPPNQFKEVQKHLQDMLDIGAIQAFLQSVGKCRCLGMKEGWQSQILH